MQSRLNTSHVTAGMLEVIEGMEDFVRQSLPSLLKPINSNWQPSDFMPDARREDFFQQVTQLQQQAAGLPKEVFALLAGNMITEEALPSYQTWFSQLKGMSDGNGSSERAWAQWSRGWSAEENRHGDLLNRYLFLSGQVNMHNIETTIQHLIAKGFDPKTENDPYQGIIYTSFQERATRISHVNTSKLAEGCGDEFLSKIGKVIAGDEARHEKAYKLFMTRIIELDPEGAIQAFYQMMQKQIVMPGVMMQTARDTNVYVQYSTLAQTTGVYTVYDYADIIDHLIEYWKISLLKGLSGETARRQDYLCNLSARYRRIAERMKFEPVREMAWLSENED